MAKPIHAQVEDYLIYCRNIRQMSDMTLRSKRHTYQHFIVGSQCRDLHQLDNVDFNRWISYQTDKGVSARTINTRMLRW